MKTNQTVWMGALRHRRAGTVARVFAFRPPSSGFRLPPSRSSPPSRAFTLIELLVVIAIIAILAGNFYPLQAQPVLTLQPEDRFVNRGATIRLVVSAHSPTPPTYQWFFNEVALADATNRVLQIVNAQPQHSGHYSVRLSNLTGAATSQTARVKVFVPGLHSVSGISVARDGSASLGFFGGATATHAHRFELFPIETSPDLQSWTPLGMAIATNASLDPLSFTDVAATAFAHRFYRTATNVLLSHLPGKPSGPYAIGSLSRLLTDPSRTNTARRTNHQFMVTIWYPATLVAGQLPAPYVERQIAQAGDLAGTGAEAYFARSQSNAPLSTAATPFPIVLYSHSAGGHRRESTDKAEELSSRGFIVIGLDHRTTSRSVFPDGKVVDGGGEHAAGLSLALVQEHARDAQFVVDELTRWNFSDPMFAGRLDLDRIGSFGWSFGGAASAELARVDPRCKAAVAMDGYFFNPNLVREPLSKPLMVLMADWEPAPGEDPRDDRRKVFEAMTRAAYLVKVAGSVHGHFADLIRHFTREKAEAWWGTWTLPLDRGQEIATALIVSFFNKHLRGEDDHVLDDVPVHFPEVKEFQKK